MPSPKARLRLQVRASIAHGARSTRCARQRWRVKRWWVDGVLPGDAIPASVDHRREGPARTTDTAQAAGVPRHADAASRVDAQRKAATRLHRSLSHGWWDQVVRVEAAHNAENTPRVPGSGPKPKVRTGRATYAPITIANNNRKTEAYSAHDERSGTAASSRQRPARREMRVATGCPATFRPKRCCRAGCRQRKQEPRDTHSADAGRAQFQYKCGQG